MRAAHKEVVNDSDSFIANQFGAGRDEPNFGKQYQHQMGQVLGPMKKNVSQDREALDKFLERCG